MPRSDVARTSPSRSVRSCSQPQRRDRRGWLFRLRNGQDDSVRQQNSKSATDGVFDVSPKESLGPRERPVCPLHSPPAQDLQRQVDTDRMVELHQWCSGFGIPKDQQFRRSQRHRDRNCACCMIDPRKDRDAFGPWISLEPTNVGRPPLRKSTLQRVDTVDLLPEQSATAVKVRPP